MNNVKSLVIVESPAKCKTIKKYLGSGYQVLASYGHVRDLVPKKGAVDTEHDFAMHYQLIEKNKKYIEIIAKEMKKADILYLATDCDREGEIIAWNVCHILEERGILKNKKVKRLVFNQITKSAVQKSLEDTREILMDLVEAQQARRVLDYLVGFNLSPLLWRKIWHGLSAGRVQSPALRLIAEREKEILAFKPREYWSILAQLLFEDRPYVAKLIVYEGNKLKQFSITDAEQAGKIVVHLKKLANGKLQVANVSKKIRRRNPAPPFITSTLQQEASRKLGFSATRTMRIAQQLYEGVNVGDGEEGLITYMRTDSVILSSEVLQDIRSFIKKHYPEASIAKSRIFKGKVKNAQEAHEAIRPTIVSHTPESIAKYLSSDQLKLYRLIWLRALACQMKHATLCTMSVDFSCHNEEHLFRLSGTHIVDPGFMKIYQEGFDQKKDADELSEDNQILPVFKVGDQVSLSDIVNKQHFTEPPPRFTEASLVKILEEYGIGRPSTYASIINTLYLRRYVERNGKQLRPTDIGNVVSYFLVKYFAHYVDYDFTRQLEDQLDEVSRGEKARIPLLENFWKPFKSLIDDIDKRVERKDVLQKDMDEACPKCSKPLTLRFCRRGQYIGCTAYPDCDYTREVEGNASSEEEKKLADGRTCPKCDSRLSIRIGRYGKFIGCTGYPTCRYLEPLKKPKDLDVKCPVCKKEFLLERQTRKGGLFFSCAGYPKCTYAQWHRPLKEKCPKCGWPLLGLKETKRSGKEKVCPQKECSFSVPFDQDKTEN